MEQKNWTPVRKLLGGERYDTPQAGEALNDLNRKELRLWLNLYLPSVKLLKKVRLGSRWRRVSEPPPTPFERVMASGQADPAQLAHWPGLMRTLDPFELAQVIEGKLERIYQLAHRHLSPKAPKSYPLRMQR